MTKKTMKNTMMAGISTSTDCPRTDRRAVKVRTIAGALGLTLALAVTTIGVVSPGVSRAATGETVPADETNDFSWKPDGSWVTAEDTTVTDEVRKMIMDSFMHVVGVGRQPVMYLGYQETESGTNHCILVRTFPVIPNPVYRYVLYYVHEDSAGKYKTYKTRLLDVSEYTDFSRIGRVADFTGFFRYDSKTDSYLFWSGNRKHGIALRKEGEDDIPDRDGSGEGIRILAAEDFSDYYIAYMDYSTNQDAVLPAMIINGSEYTFENGRIYLNRVPEASRYEITMAGAEKPKLRIVSLSRKKLSLKTGKRATVKARVSYGMEDSVTLVWKSSNRKIASVANGVIRAKKKGTCVITCRIKGDPSTKVTCKVTVR